MFDMIAQTESLGLLSRGLPIAVKVGKKIAGKIRERRQHRHDDDSSSSSSSSSYSTPAATPTSVAADPDVCNAVHGIFHESICYVPLMQIDDDYSDS